MFLGFFPFQYDKLEEKDTFYSYTIEKFLTFILFVRKITLMLLSLQFSKVLIFFLTDGNFLYCISYFNMPQSIFDFTCFFWSLCIKIKKKKCRANYGKKTKLLFS